MKRQRIVSLGVMSLLLGLAATTHAQSKIWARGSFKLPMDVKWNKKDMAQGEYQFRVESLSGAGQIQLVVIVVQEGAIKGVFMGPKQWVRGGKGLLPRLVLHIDSESGIEKGKEGQFVGEVVEMEIPGPNYRLRFGCKHKKKKGLEGPHRATVLFLTMN